MKVVSAISSKFQERILDGKLNFVVISQVILGNYDGLILGSRLKRRYLHEAVVVRPLIPD